MDAIYLFVYGTLKRGQRNHGLLRGQTFVGEAVTAPLYRLFDFGPYPCLVPAPEGGKAIHGEVFLVQAALLPRLDRLEGAPTVYQLQPIRLANFPHPTQAYFYRLDTTGLRECGERWPCASPGK